MTGKSKAMINLPQDQQSQTRLPVRYLTRCQIPMMFEPRGQFLVYLAHLVTQARHWSGKGFGHFYLLFPNYHIHRMPRLTIPQHIAMATSRQQRRSQRSILCNVAQDPSNTPDPRC